MNIYHTQDVQSCKEEVESLLVKREAENNLPLGLLKNFPDSKSEQPPSLIYIKDHGRIVSMAMRTPPHLWILPSISTTSQETIERLVHFIVENNLELPGVLGEQQAVQWFIDACEQAGKFSAQLHMRQGIYRLDELRPIDLQSGELIVADQSHLSLAKQWFRQYAIELDEPMMKEQAEQTAESMISDQKMHLWVVDGEPVSMVNQARVTPNGVTINGVYTPDHFKKKGYATQATYHLSKKLLNSGYQFCSLYTDLDNPTSNSIYKRIGYVWAGNSVVYHIQTLKGTDEK
ncbi:GNAT family N-acetyltransferase [Halobacillus locisalis]|uniref:GNAT family N-acetyltransferase n=1 Tax=Halobacillus locisalis TaxID=220753 RepID=A0A838CSW7_9BACI|nr:GNAT family N-acetyltransferase [Halobacillus locisalis]MBA2175167.1 GNAT family N-acetyltransferase [Halobacillus locisalis]